MREIWKKVNSPELPDHYEISNLGRLRSLPYIDKRGWKRALYYHSFNNAEVSLKCLDGKSRCFPVAALVLKTFVGMPGPGQYLARHLDDNRKNNQVTNLAWGNDADNHRDALRNGANFTSYGHLGKHHSDATKALLSKQKRGKPTGRKMSAAHRAAITAGYRKRFPEKHSQSCACGCGKLTKPGRTFIHSHAGGQRFAKQNKERIGKPRAW